jgi:site-specific DNA recombinase
MNKLAASLNRISTDEQIDGYGLDVQEKANAQYAAELGYTIPEKYIFSEQVSGTVPLWERPKQKKLYQMAMAGDVKAIFIHRLDRLGRDMWTSGQALSNLLKAGVSVFITEKHKQIKDSTDIEEVFYLWKGDVDRQDIIRRLKNGRDAKVAKKKLNGNGPAPFGYRQILKTAHNDNSIEIDESEAKIVRMVFDWYLSGLGTLQIANKLTSMRISSRGDTLSEQRKDDSNGNKKQGKKRMGNGIWHINMVRNVLTNENYVGIFYHNQYETKTDKGVLLYRRMRPKEEWIEINIPQIISREDFDKVQSMLKEKSGSTRKKHSYLLSGLLHCAECGYAISGHHRRYEKPNGLSYEYSRYRCNSQTNHRQVTCNLPAVQTFKIELEFVKFINWILEENPEKRKKKTAKVEDNTASQLADIDARIAKWEQQERMLLDRYLAGKLKQSLYDEKQEEIDTALAGLKEEKNKLVEKKQATVTPEEYQTVQEKWNSLSTNQEVKWKKTGKNTALLAVPVEDIETPEMAMFWKPYRELAFDLKMSGTLFRENGMLVLLMTSGVKGAESKRVEIEPTRNK